ncbi:MAG: hypothetical protein ACP5JB_07725 [candidate division WOR-3 bacterium]
MSSEFTGEKIVPIRVQPPDCWLSYLGAVATLLRSRGVKCDLTAVAGLSGYAFIINIHPELLPTGPVAFDWEVLIEGTQALGLETELVAVERGPDDPELFRELFLRVREEIDQDRCCIVWGAGDGPEFRLVCGYRNDAYVVLSPGGNRLVRYDRLMAVWRIAGIFFGEPVELDPKNEERKAVLRAVKLLRGTAPCFDAEYHYGARAFRVWAESVTAGSADDYGFIYNLMCYYELQMFAAGFCVRLARQHRQAGVHLGKAGDFFKRSFKNLAQIETMAPNAASRQKNALRIAELLNECAHLNEQAVEELERALVLM